MDKSKTYSKKVMLIIDFVLIALLIAGDQIIKYFVARDLNGSSPVVLIPKGLELYYLENRGSAFGILQNQKFFILFIGFIFLAVILFLLIKLPLMKKFVPAHVFLSLIIAGGVGNMIDRFRLSYVVDYIHCTFIYTLFKYDFPIFNFADCCVVIGVIILVILFLFVYKEQDLEFLKFKQNRYRNMDK